MKRLKLITLLTFIGIYAAAFSQKEITDLVRSNNVKIKNSDPYTVVDAHNKKYFVTENGVLAVKIKRGKGTQRKFIFQIFDGHQLNLVKTKEEQIKEPGFIYEFIEKIGDKLYLFYSIYDKENTTEQLFVREIDQQNGGFSGSPKQILKVPEKIVSYFMGRGKFQLDVSADETKFVIKYKYYPENKNDSKNHDRLGMLVFDSNLDIIWKNDITMPEKESMMQHLDFTVDSRGDGYFLYRKFKEELTRKTALDPDNFSITILKVGANGELNEAEFKLKDYLVQDISFKENENNEIICAGYYRQPKVFNIKGVFVATLNQDGEISPPNYYDFSLDFVKQYQKVSEKRNKKLKKADEEGRTGIYSLDMTDIRILKGGGILLAGEVFYVTTRTDAKGNTYTTNHYDDIILTKINADGELDWMKKIPKRSTFESFKLLTSDQFIYVVFTDNPNNSTLEEDMKASPSTTSGYVVAHRLDIESGEKDYLPLFKRNKIDDTPVYQFGLYRLIGISETTFAVELYIKRKKDMMFKIEFEER